MSGYYGANVIASFTVVAVLYASRPADLYTAAQATLRGAEQVKAGAGAGAGGGLGGSGSGLGVWSGFRSGSWVGIALDLRDGGVTHRSRRSARRR
ncbi:hypothetical protein SFUMM280S_02706 [Streptomyces fumanus]